MKIVIRGGYQYFDLGGERYVLVMDENGDPLKENDREWVETGPNECTLFPKTTKTDQLH